MDTAERLAEVEKGIKEFGWDFFLIDTRVGVPVNAAPFHITNKRDKNCFVDYASSVIPWKASANTALARDVHNANERFMAAVAGI